MANVRIPTVELNRVPRVFASNPWFSTLPASEAANLLAASVSLHIPRDACAFREGDPVSKDGGAFFGVISGALKLQRLAEDGSEACIAVIEPGNWFGEVACLDNLPRPNSAVALEDCSLLAVTAVDFARLMKSPAFSSSIASLTARRLRIAYDLMCDASLLDLQRRVARRLLMLAHGDVSLLSDVRHEIRISQDTVATLLGVTRSTLNIELQKLERIGAIKPRYGRIEIRDLKRLQDCCL